MSYDSAVCIYIYICIIEGAVQYSAVRDGTVRYSMVQYGKVCISYIIHHRSQNIISLHDCTTTVQYHHEVYLDSKKPFYTMLTAIQIQILRAIPNSDTNTDPAYNSNDY